MSELRLRGRPAAPGLASGALFVLAATPAPAAVAAAVQAAGGGDPLQQSEALRKAIDAALRALRALIAHSAGTSTGTGTGARSSQAGDPAPEQLTAIA